MWDTLVTNGVAQLMAGPELDQLQLVQDAWWDFTWNDPWDRGLFDDVNYTVQSVAPTQTVYYYQIRVSYPQTPGFVQYSTTLKLIAGGGSQPTPSSDGLQFYTWAEWPSPTFFNSFVGPEPAPYSSNTPWIQLQVASENSTLKVRFTDWVSAIQWRKDGMPIPDVTNISASLGWTSHTPQLVITNTRPEDAGVYDLVINGGISRGISPRISVSVQTQNGAGIFQSPRQSENQFLADFVGAAGRNYIVECSTNLVNWTNLLTLTNTTGTLGFSNSVSPDGNLFYRSRLLP